MHWQAAPALFLCADGNGVVIIVLLGLAVRDIS
jgi:hypothetical protein